MYIYKYVYIYRYIYVLCIQKYGYIHGYMCIFIYAVSQSVGHVDAGILAPVSSPVSKSI